MAPKGSAKIAKYLAMNYHNIEQRAESNPGVVVYSGLLTGAIIFGAIVLGIMLLYPRQRQQDCAPLTLDPRSTHPPLADVLVRRNTPKKLPSLPPSARTGEVGKISREHDSDSSGSLEDVDLS
ncbi:Uu.00g037040.m01.CDS01 [Anthostomella pinea]|uniref:Uu.00g037040.m01.CDS01 n=1 Tax=Anthostomella pinea TaxID=933095 RepID=A0AAI8YDI5_9PEZI|nr:Uu.00g037040.m01.CDS01 [Anthostomella pinea]